MRKLDSFQGLCFSPRALRGRDIRTLRKTDLEGEFNPLRVPQVFMFLHRL